VTDPPSAASAALILGARAEHQNLAHVLNRLGFDAVQVDMSDATDAVDALEQSLSLCLLDLTENGAALRFARVIRGRRPNTLLIGLADPSRPASAAEAIRAGVFDVLPRSPSVHDIEALLANAREQARLSAAPPPPADVSPFGIVGSSPAMRLVLGLVERAAAGRAGILICGERGTGRELIARAIHAGGPNHDQPFVKVDCSAPDIELQLFGVVNRRSGSGAPERRVLERVDHSSQIHDARTGILFLEHLIEMPARVQARLVRVLRDREVFVDNQREPVAIDVRPIASVDGTIDAALDEGRLRQDLYDRLSLIRIDVPALRQRREDIPTLATHFLKDLCRSHGTPLKTLTRPALTLISALPLRGNAPELRTLLERLVLMVPSGLIRLEDVLVHTQLEATISPTGLDATLRQARARFEREYIAAVLQHHRGRIAEAARVLGIQRTNLYRKMRRLNVMHSGPSSKAM
jgi:DNA-binding NtrC family response regulator